MTRDRTNRRDQDARVSEEPPESEPLGGGIANAGAVFKRGSVVVRPSGPHSAAVQSLMRRWRQAGVDEVPEPLGLETGPEDGVTRELVAYVPGRVAGVDDEWVTTSEALAAVAAVQKRLHDAAGTFPDLGSQPWGAQGYIPEQFLPPTAPVARACHNDLCVTNIVFDLDEATVAGVIDWDYAQPVDPLFDIAVAMRHWVPFADPADRAPAWADTDAFARFSVWADIMTLDAQARSQVLDVAISFLDQAHHNVAGLARRNVGAFADLVAGGYLDRNRRDRQWIVDNHAALTA